jgi:MFS family permease
MMTADTKAPPRFLRIRLAVQIFLAYAVMGAWLPIFTLYLTQQLGFSPQATAWASATNAIGALIAPLFWGQIADRWLAMERSLSLCALGSGIGLFALTALSGPWAVFFTCVAIWFFLVPLIGLTSSLIFRQLDHPERDFGRIRVWGTLGWMTANWLLTWWFEESPAYSRREPDLGDSLRLGGIAAFVVALYALTLPHTPPRPSSSLASPSWLGRLTDAPWSAMQLFRNRSFLVYCVCMFGLYITFPFPVQMNPLLLRHLQFDERQVPLVLTIAQSTEAISLFLLPVFLTRLGVKRTMLLGCIAWGAGLWALSIGSPDWFVMAAMASHGLFISCFVIAGQVFVNKQATHDIRASVQGLLVLVNGCGLLLGHLLVGVIRAGTQDNFAEAYLIAACIAAVLAVTFLLGFTPEPAAAVLG